MHHFIDRRQNPKGKSLGNRQRFLRRTRHHLKEMVNQAMKRRSVRDVENGEAVTIPTKSVDEPHFVLSPTAGSRQRIFPGNKEFTVGDRIRRPSAGGGEAGRRGAPDGGGEDGFRFVLTREEFLDILFDELELPDLVKTDLTDVRATKLRRGGHTGSGTRSNLNVLRTMRNAYSRRLALGRPRTDQFNRLAAEIAALEAEDPRTAEMEVALSALRAELGRMQAKRRRVAFVDPIDVRYHRFTPEEQPTAKAVMFCLMDVSSSMGEREKELAKRFFILLHLFLGRRYEATEIVFIRHTHFAQEVDEETFFYGRETGGTMVSTALVEMEKIIAERFPTNDWNIYVAQASDGDNYSGDSQKCAERLNENIMRLCQYFAYVEIVEEMSLHDMLREGELWQAYRSVGEKWSNFQMRRVSNPADIYPVFRDLFAKRQGA